MPSRNVLKVDIQDSYYHVYARGHSRNELFLDDADYSQFIRIIQRYLSVEPQHSVTGEPYAHLYGKLELLCYCLMPNHFHMLLYQRDEGAMQSFMRGVMTSYSCYFNKKYQRSGSLYESRYKASRISDPSYFTHISRYIHLNRKDWRTTPYSSIAYYLGGAGVEWLRPERVLQLFLDRKDYETFVADYEEHKAMLDTLKYELADAGQT